jgi:hydrogenase maturation protease
MNSVHTLVIAYGNSLRGDDAVGSAAAGIVESWQTPGVKVRSVHQLVPELIDDMKEVGRVLFIDAGTKTNDSKFDTCVVEPKQSRRFFGHFETPANLLALLCELDGRIPETWLLAISAYSFGHGDELSETAQDNLHAAIEWIREFLAEPTCTKLG